MKKKFQVFCSQYAGSLFLILSIALLFLVLESISQKPIARDAIEGAYTVSSLPIAEVDIVQIVVIGMIGLLVVGMLFAIQVKYEKKK